MVKTSEDDEDEDSGLPPPPSLPFAETPSSKNRGENFDCVYAAKTRSPLSAPSLFASFQRAVFNRQRPFLKARVTQQITEGREAKFPFVFREVKGAFGDWNFGSML